MPKANEMIVQVLEEAGIEFVFGVPGGGTGAIYQQLYDRQDRINVILVRHEQVAAIIADAYGRASGKPAVIMGQGVFMGSNASFGIMEAVTSSSPMLILTDTSDGNMAQHPANQSGAGEYGSIDLPNIFRAMTKYTTLATQPKEAVIGTQLAIKHAVSGRPGPACVLMRSASIVGEVDLEAAPFIHHTAGYLNTSKPQAPPQDVRKAAEILAGARSPVLVAGQGVRLAGAEDDSVALAESLGMAVTTTYKGKSVIEETHPLSVGMAGVYGQGSANTAISDADVVLVVGAKLTPQDTVREGPQVFDPKRQRIIQIDIEERNTGWTFPVEVGLVGDAKAILGQLSEALGSLAMPDATERDRRARLIRERNIKLEYGEGDPALRQESSPVMPQRLVRVTEESLDPSTLISLDAGNNRVWMAHFYRSRQRDTIFAPGGLAGMGWALPAALGLQLAQPDRPVACVSGDGGFMMTLNALSTAVQYNLPIVGIVMNDSALGMVRHHQYGKTIASEFIDTNFAELARGFGAHGVRIDDSKDLGAAIREAQAMRKPAVIDVITDRGPTPDDLRANTRGATET